MKLGNDTNAYSLLLLWGIQCIPVLGICAINPNHFTTVDSGYYLQSAQNILNGNGYSILENGSYCWNSTFPPGYSIAISIVAYFTSLPVLWASKLVNLLASGIWLYQLRKDYGSKKALFTGSLLLLGPFLKLWCHTWSEPLFLILLYNWVNLLFSPNQRFSKTLLLGIALILVRYAGVFIIPLSLGMSIYWYFNDRKKVACTLMLGGVWTGFFVALLLINHQLSGEYYGSERFGFRENPFEVILLFVKGIGNELLLFRDTNWSDFDLPFGIGLLLQIVLLWPLLNRSFKFPSIDRFQLTAICYLFFLIVIRLFSPFDDPGYRLLSPLSFLIGCSLLDFQFDQLSRVNLKVYSAIVLASWLQLLPQGNWVNKLQIAWEHIVLLIPALHN